MKIMIIAFKRSHACTATLSAPNPAAGHHQPMPPPETPGQSQESLSQSLVGSLLLSPGSWCTQGSVRAHQESVSPSFVRSGGSTVGLVVASSSKLMPYPSLLYPEPLSLWQPTADPYVHRRRSNTVLSQSLWGPWVLVHTRFVLSPLSVSGRNGV